MTSIVNSNLHLVLKNIILTNIQSINELWMIVAIM